MSYGIENRIKKMIVDMDTVDSCEIFVCKCLGCNSRFAMGCSDSREMEYCPFCGYKVDIELINEQNRYLEAFYEV